MNENTLKGTLDKVTGKIKETVGELTKNEELKREGEAEQVKGAARESLGHAQDAGEDAVDTVKKSPVRPVLKQLKRSRFALS